LNHYDKWCSGNALRSTRATAISLQEGATMFGNAQMIEGMMKKKNVAGRHRRNEE